MTRHFFDIGANAGQTFDWLATQPHDYRDHVFHCFEPSPRHFAALIAKLREQAARGYHINLYPLGLAGKTGIATLHEKDDSLGDSFQAWTASDHSPENIQNGYIVRAATLSLASAILQFTAPLDQVVLDIDAEGAEYEMLQNLGAVPEALQRVRRILVEFHHVRGKDCSIFKQALIEYYAKKGITLEVRGFVP